MKVAVTDPQTVGNLYDLTEKDISGFTSVVLMKFLKQYNSTLETRDSIMDLLFLVFPLLQWYHEGIFWSMDPLFIIKAAYYCYFSIHIKSKHDIIRKR